MGRDTDFRVPVDGVERATLTAAADALGLTVPTFLREAGLREARRLAKGLALTAAELPPLVDQDAAAWRATEARLDAALARVPRLADPAIADELGVTVDVVRRHREGRGIAAVEGRSRTGWEDILRGLHGRGLTAQAMAAETGWTLGSVRTRLSSLGLRAARSSS